MSESWIVAMIYQSTQVLLASLDFKRPGHWGLYDEFGPSFPWHPRDPSCGGFNDHRSAVWPGSLSVVAEELERQAAEQVLAYWERHGSLLRGALDAQDAFSLDELEDYAAAQRGAS